MFLRRPLTNERITKEKNDEFSFGYPHNLIAGVTLTDKKEQKTKKIFSLYELEIGNKYTTELGFTVTRISHDELHVCCFSFVNNEFSLQKQAKFCALHIF